MTTRPRLLPSVAAAALALAAAACAGSDDAGELVQADETTTSAVVETSGAPTTELFAPVTTATPPTTTTTVPPATTTTTSTTTTTISTTTTTTTSTTTTTTTLPAGPVAETFDLTADRQLLGRSIEGREIVAERYGTPGDRRVLVIGVIHGNEDAGLQIVDRLRERVLAEGPPAGVEFWLVPSMNPDGTAAQDRHNANQVDLNRNFPHNWGPIGEPGDSQYAGIGPASEPETQLMVNFIEQLRPDIAIWYHQDAYLVIPSTGRDGRIRARYAELTGLPLAHCCGGGGGIYTGIAATWARQELQPEESVAFIVELGGTTSPEEVVSHADAVMTIAVEG